MKYIIKNCPKAIKFPTETICQGKAKHCQDIPSQHCLLKQIAEKCKANLKNIYTMGEAFLAREILNMLEIEEIEQ